MAATANGGLDDGDDGIEIWPTILATKSLLVLEQISEKFADNSRSSLSWGVKSPVKIGRGTWGLGVGPPRGGKEEGMCSQEDTNIVGNVFSGMMECVSCKVRGISVVL